jgi:hypothetical protein
MRLYCGSLLMQSPSRGQVNLAKNLQMIGEDEKEECVYE